MAVLKQVTFERKRIYLPATGPQAVGKLKAAVGNAPATKRGPKASTNTRTLARPAQGKNSLTSV
jgi:hypothetical protein